MAVSLSSCSYTLPLLPLSLLLLLPLSHQQDLPSLDSGEQESVYLALESVNSDIPWRTLFPDDLCLSAPHGVVCGYFRSSTNDTVLVSHIIEMNFGYVSDSSQNPPCSPESEFPFSLFSLPHLRKLFFYRCFTHRPVSFPLLNETTRFGLELEELVFMENPSLSGSLSGSIGNFTSLRRLILTGSNVSGGIPDEITKLSSLEQLTISGNPYLGRREGNGVPLNVGMLGKLRILDLSNNGLEGTVPKSLGQLKSLIKLDLSINRFSGEIPASLKGLRSLQFLDLSYNRFGNFGVPLFLGSMTTLKELYLSGNPLGGAIPEIWENLGGLLGIGLSGVGLVGHIPASMGVFLRNLSYIWLDNNKLDGEVPEEFGLLQNVYEMNFQNNQLSGGIPFSAQFVAQLGMKLKLEGNPSLCVDKSIKKSLQNKDSLVNLKACNGTQVHTIALFNGSVSLHLDWCLMILLVGFWSFHWL